MKGFTKGFTLIELIIVIALLGILASYAARYMTQGYSSYRTATDLMSADWQARIALERMTKEIRSVRSAQDITVASASQLTFSDIKNNTITYSINANRLMRLNSAGLSSNQILADNISALNLTYFDKSGIATSNRNLIKYIGISLAISNNKTYFTVATKVYLRDLT